MVVIIPGSGNNNLDLRMFLLLGFIACGCLSQ